MPPHYSCCSGSGQGQDHIWSGRWGRDSRPSSLTYAAPALPTADLPLLVAPENCVRVVLRPAVRRNARAPILSLAPSSQGPGWGVCFHVAALGFGAPPADGQRRRPAGPSSLSCRSLVGSRRQGGERLEDSAPLGCPQDRLATRGTAWPVVETLWGLLLRGGPARAEHGGDRQALTSPVVSGQKTVGRPEGGTLQTGSLFSPMVLALQGFGVVISHSAF